MNPKIIFPIADSSKDSIFNRPISEHLIALPVISMKRKKCCKKYKKRKNSRRCKSCPNVN